MRRQGGTATEAAGGLLTPGRRLETITGARTPARVPTLTRVHAPGPQAAPVEAPELESQFATALRSAIAARGLSLDRIRGRMLARGCTVSVATLSYWQSGRSRPERPSSLIALGHLEDVLEVPRGFLVAKANPGMSAVEHNYQAPPAPSRAGRESDVVAAAVAHLGLTFEDGLRRLSYHDLIEVKANRTDGSHFVRMVLQATRDGVDRYPVYCGHDDMTAFPFVMAVTNCHVGRVIEFRDDASLIAEMKLDRPLAAGESVLVEYRMEAVGQSAEFDHFHRLIAAPIRELLLDVRFHPAAIPAAGEKVATVDGIHTVQPLPAPAPTLRTLELDVAPGVYGINWSW